MCLSCHVVVVKAKFKNLVALALAAQRLGGQLRIGQKEYRWYGKWMDDYSSADAAYKQGVRTEDYGKCDHAITFPNTKYEIGVLEKEEKGEKEYTLVWDKFELNLQQVLGGEQAGLFIQAYSLELEKLKAQEWGYVVEEEKQANGDIVLKCTMWED